MAEVLRWLRLDLGQSGGLAWERLDWRLALTVLALAGLGLVMVGSASVSIAEGATGDPLHYLYRQAVFLAVALMAAVACLHLSLDQFYRGGPVLLVLGFFLLLVVLIPGVGREVNGATRWIPLGLINLQVAEVARVCFIIYLAGYCVRRHAELPNTSSAFAVPLAVFSLAAVLLLAQPDFGTALVLMATALGLLFLAGASLWRIGVLGLLLAGAAWLLIVGSPYRWQRLTTFTDPWADPFNAGFQLTQSLIAIGRGEWFGVGLGASVQKLFYLPEAHTDFLFAVLAEELGLLGVVVVVALFTYLAWRGMQIGLASLRADRPFGAYLAWGLTISIGLQAFINMAVTMGLLPTKGLTLPLMSYGGSSLIMTGIALALLLRVDYEARLAAQQPRPRKRPSGRVRP
ncbi:putative lipid II flippase FtsW [Alkalilimnicola ehrlichii MLHE-1]|uniref:Probable peptidoglycan glycosyltransferase FtsW n=1 Tax=Alkalilimnicola ehrlichii (strain ATCC BAA-1101 / DSM 17681 / MLHE-1) TaxID=187272 RepID=FTSW_ALKEH|nr:putative lipid II flippase FtsW [Alkalilimnicola ehrlichii]Q0A6K1.1 RecName: Full=Probable peptidoglycan glycosyltransferase FtsW; Short=PGT; AltName: Full=Cell division protein FtsW; AltName: Full=Cell wall polymerase; AltName: Full=Peptidoglycan polymerase; Short=PG polymerase [Alkalilimnicola ehrlichii MLHE-1]ABI57536.1 cell division-specific peptidoglycan biosynthesis regulator FtsW [Alkalilimnicola ehrlichii MLHE-1]